MAQQIIRDFINKPQSETGEHSTPKTLSLIDTTEKGFPAFLTAFDEYLGALAELLDAGNDIPLFTLLHRARSGAISYSPDRVVDLGSFIVEFDRLCSPKPDSVLGRKSHNVREAYDAIYVARDFGPGTIEGTGMIFDMPRVAEYISNPSYWSDLLGLKKELWEEAPNYLNFFREYITSKLPRTSGESVCRGDVLNQQELSEDGAAMSSAVQPLPVGKFQLAPPYLTDRSTDPTGDGEKEGPGLFVEPTILNDGSNGEDMVFTTCLDVEATSVDAMFGLDVTNLVTEAKAKHDAGSGTRFLRRKLSDEQQAAEDFLVMYGGIAAGDFESTERANSTDRANCKDFLASWDRNFYVITEEIAGGESRMHPVFVEEQEDPTAARRVQVIFFEPNTQPIRDTRSLPPGTNIQEAEDAYFGYKAYLEYHVDEHGQDSYTLYVCRYIPKMNFDLLAGGTVTKMGTYKNGLKLTYLELLFPHSHLSWLSRSLWQRLQYAGPRCAWVASPCDSSAWHGQW
jgi:hypothetical protein